METKSLYSEVAIDLLLGQVDRSQPQTQTACYGCTSVRADHNDHPVTPALSETNVDRHQHIPRPFSHSSDGYRKTEQNRRQNTPKKSCTELASELHFTGFSKDVFPCRPPTNFGGNLAGIFAPPKQESGAKNDNSVHGHFFKMPSREDVQFFGRTGSVGEYTSGDFWGCKQLLLTQLLISNTITQFDCSVQG